MTFHKNIGLSSMCYKSLQSLRDASTICSILQIKRVPVDKNKNPLIYLVKNEVKNIFTDEYFGCIYTPKIRFCNINGIVVDRPRFMTDDMTYKLYPELQKMIPRCYSVLIIFKNDEEKQAVSRFVVRGYLKFGGSAKDEDSNIDTHNLISEKDIKNSDRVIITEKSNGKAAVITMFVFEGKLFVFGGSKNQHYVGRMEKGMIDFNFLNRDFFAWQIFEAFFKKWNSISENSQKSLAMKLVKGHTLCAEFEDGKHMIPLPEKEPRRLRVFGLTKCDENSFCEDVLESLNFLKNSELFVTQFSVHKFEEISSLKENLLEKDDVEGFVIHYQKMVDNKFETITTEKFKTWNYVMLRILREFLRAKRLENDNWRKILWARIQKRNRDFLGMPMSFLLKWKERLFAFVEWYKKKDFGDSIVNFDADSKGMGYGWKMFIDENPAFKTPLKMTAEEKAQRQKLKNSPSAEKNGLLVIFQGIPGLGKTFLAYPLAEFLREIGFPTVSLEQDQFALKNGSTKFSGKRCLQHFFNLISGGKTRVILLTRNNANFGQVEKYTTIASQNNWAVHVFSPAEMPSLFLLAVCLHAVAQRENQTGENAHLTFKNMPLAQMFSITVAFYCAFKKIAQIWPVGKVDTVEWFKKGVAKKLNKQQINLLNNLVEEAKKKSNPFNFSLSKEKAVEIKKVLDFDHFNYSDFRLNQFEIVNSIFNCLAANSLLKISKNLPKMEDELNFRKIVNPSVNYACIKIPNTVYEKMLDILNTDDIDIENLDTKPKSPHITLIYNNKKSTQSKMGRKTWQKIHSLFNSAEIFFVAINGIAVERGRILCFTCRIHSAANAEDFSQTICFSGHPHITVLRNSKVKPVESINLLEKISESKENEMGKSLRFYKLKNDITFEGKIEFMRFN